MAAWATKGTVAVASVVAALALAGSAAAESWRYPGGSFESVGGKSWVQHRDADAADPFQEVHRSADYVELYDASRLLYVRLYAGACYWRHTAGPNWTKGADRSRDDGPGWSGPDLLGD